MKYLALPILGLVALTAAALTPDAAEAVVCARGFRGAGCAGPRGAVVAPRPVVAPRAVVVRPRPVMAPRVRVIR